MSEVPSLLSEEERRGGGRKGFSKCIHTDLGKKKKEIKKYKKSIINNNISQGKAVRRQLA